MYNASTLDQLQHIAEEHSGKCVSKEYRGSHTKLLWECSRGHRWEAIPAIIKRGTWCPECYYKKVKVTLNEMQQIAKERGGKCLSQSCNGSRTKLLWECSEGHRWRAAASNIKKGTWCHRCYFNSRKSTIEDMQKIAKKHGGKCLSEEYENARTKLNWECSKGHIWKATPTNINQGKWCPACAGRKVY